MSGYGLVIVLSFAFLEMLRPCSLSRVVVVFLRLFAVEHLIRTLRAKYTGRKKLLYLAWYAYGSMLYVRRVLFEVQLNSVTSVFDITVTFLFFVFFFFPGQSFRFKPLKTMPQTAGFSTFSQVSFWQFTYIIKVTK